MKNIIVPVLALAFTASFAFTGEGKACDIAKHAKKAAACPSKAMIAEGKPVVLTGNVLCNHGSGKKDEKCGEVFQAADVKKTKYEICMMSDIKTVEKLSNHGKTLLTVTGKLVKTDDGGTMLLIEKAEKVSRPVA